MKRILSLLLAMACVLSLFSMDHPTATAANKNTQVQEVSKVTIQNVGTGQYLNFDYGKLQNGTYVRVWPWDGTVEQQWTIDHVSGSTYRILTFKSDKYCLDVYRGNSKLKAGQKCDIWKTGDDSVAQNLLFYLCDDGSYVLRMENNPALALAATASKDRVKLVKFDPSSKAQKWIFKDANGKKIDIRKDSDAEAKNGIPSTAYKQTGVVYFINGTAYVQAKTTRTYNEVAKDTMFFLNAKGQVVTDAAILDKLHTMSTFNLMRKDWKHTAELQAYAANNYLDACQQMTANEKLGSLIGVSSGLLLNIGAGDGVGITEAAWELGEEVVEGTFKATVLLGILQVFTNDTNAYGGQAASVMENPVIDYDNMRECMNLLAQCNASLAVVEYLAGDQVREMAGSSVAGELARYFENVFLGFADSVLPDIDAVEMAKSISDGIVELTEFAINCGAITVFEESLSETMALLPTTYPLQKALADKLAKAEEMVFVKPLTSKYSTNITTQKWGAYYSKSGYHLGVDLGTSGNRSTNVVSITEGVVYRVMKTNQSGGWGNFVIVKHQLLDGTVFYSGYGHLKSISVKVGQSVEAGTKIGVMGSTGYSTGPHLHLLVFTGTLKKNSVPLGYTRAKIKGNTYTYGRLTYYNPMEVISTQGDIIKGR